LAYFVGILDMPLLGVGSVEALSYARGSEGTGLLIVD